MLCLSGFEQYSRWVPLRLDDLAKIILLKLQGLMSTEQCVEEA